MLPDARYHVPFLTTMKNEVERRQPEGIRDHLALGITTWGVGYLPLAPGTWGSMVGIAIYILLEHAYVALAMTAAGESVSAVTFGAWASALLLFFIVLLAAAGIWGSGRSIELLGNEDPSEAVVDEVLGQLIVFLFVPFGLGWSLIVAGFLLFRLFDIWKPYPINDLQQLKGGLGICADDIVAGVYAGIVLAIIYAITLSFG